MPYYKFYLPNGWVVGAIDANMDILLRALEGRCPVTESPTDFLELNNACQIEVAQADETSPPDVRVIPQCMPGEIFRIRKSSVYAVLPLDESSEKIIDEKFIELKKAIKEAKEKTGLWTPGNQ